MRRAGLEPGVPWAAALVLTAGLALAAPGAAVAHDELASSSPASGATVASALTRVSLRFEEAPAEVGRGSTVLQVTASDGTHHETTCARIVDDSVRAGVALGRSGTYTVTWRVVSADGHPVSGAYDFTYRAPSGARIAEGSADGPDCGISASSTSADEGAGPPIGLLVGGAAGVLVVVGALVAGAIVLSRRSAGVR